MADIRSGKLVGHASLAGRICLSDADPVVDVCAVRAAGGRDCDADGELAYDPGGAGESGQEPSLGVALVPDVSLRSE